MDKKQIEENIIATLQTIFDPEIPVDIYQLGLIYEININDESHADVVMTLTTPNCPVAESMPQEVQDKVEATEGVTSAKVELVFDPPWDKDMMTEEAKLELGFM